MAQRMKASSKVGVLHLRTSQQAISRIARTPAVLNPGKEARGHFRQTGQHSFDRISTHFCRWIFFGGYLDKCISLVYTDIQMRVSSGAAH